MNQTVFNVLFLCTGNSVRSIMAEALLNHHGKSRFRAFSAGGHPVGTVNPLTLERLALEGIPAEGARSKSWDEFATPDAEAIDFAITVCDTAAGELCPFWQGQPITAHWGVPDPMAIDDELKFIEFAKAFAILERRIGLFINLNPAGLERMVFEQKVREIGQ